MPPTSVATASMAAPTPMMRPQAVSRPSYTPGPQQYTQQSMSPAPQFQRAASGQPRAFSPATPQQSLARTAVPPPSYPAAQIPPPPSTNYGLQPPRPTPSSYRDPPPIEVYTLPDAANASIPPEIREQFDRDEQGRVLFFTAPPVHLTDDTSTQLGHSIKYLAEKSRREEETARKRKAFEISKAEAKLAKKKAKIEEAVSLQEKVRELKKQALETLQNQLIGGARNDIQGLYGDDWKGGLDTQLTRLAERQKEALEKRRVLEAHERERMENSSVKLGSAGTLLGNE